MGTSRRFYRRVGLRGRTVHHAGHRIVCILELNRSSATDAVPVRAGALAQCVPSSDLEPDAASIQNFASPHAATLAEGIRVRDRRSGLLCTGFEPQVVIQHERPGHRSVGPDRIGLGLVGGLSIQR